MTRRQCPHCGRIYLEDWRVACPADGRALRVVTEEAAVPLPEFPFAEAEAKMRAEEKREQENN